MGITLVAPVGDVAERLVDRAHRDAAADEVTAPVTPGNTWTPERLAWMRDYLARCSDGPGGIDGPARESAWAVVVDGEPVGAVRLQRTEDADRLETGVWLARSVRGRGLAASVLAAVVVEARAAGATWLDAETAATNPPAQATLRRHGFTLTEAKTPGRVRATLRL